MAFTSEFLERNQKNRYKTSPSHSQVSVSKIYPPIVLKIYLNLQHFPKDLRNTSRRISTKKHSRYSITANAPCSDFPVPEIELKLFSRMWARILERASILTRSQAAYSWHSLARTRDTGVPVARDHTVERVGVQVYEHRGGKKTKKN